MQNGSTLSHSCLALSLLFAAGCERAADEQKQANQAQIEANQEITEVNQKARDQAVKAQVEADKKIAEANADFQNMREDYRHKNTERLVGLDKDIADLEAKAKTATGKAKTDLEAKLPAIRDLRAQFARDFSALESATATSWDAAKANLEKAWDNLKKTVDDVD